MAIDITTIKPKEVDTPKRNVGPRRDLGPNHWLNPDWEYNLKTSFQENQAFAADFKGKIEPYTITRGEKAGQEGKKVVGEAGDAITLIREAATKLGLGVRVTYKASKRNGYVEVSWYGQPRKKTRPRGTNNQPSTGQDQAGS